MLRGRLSLILFLVCGSGIVHADDNEYKDPLFENEDDKRVLLIACLKLTPLTEKAYFNYVVDAILETPMADDIKIMTKRDANATVVGLPGPPGLPGLPGTKGRSGDRGIDGFPGAKGDRGDDGRDGPPGLPGMKGEKGESVINGLPEFKGDRGGHGLDGMPGHPGEKGDRGHPGFPGPRGPKGNTGSPGLKGDKGDSSNSALKMKRYLSIRKHMKRPKRESHDVTNEDIEDILYYIEDCMKQIDDKSV